MNDAYWVLAPVITAFAAIVITRRAALSLFLGVCVGVLVLSGGNLLVASKSLFVDHFFPALSGPWHVGPIIFTLLLGSFAQVLERSGGFQSLLESLLKGSKDDSQRKGMLAVYGLGLLCFFDGLANAILVGRVARPMTDRIGVSRQLLAYVVDSTSSAVACIAFVSTWIATQLSLIQDGVAGTRADVGAAELYFRSIPANPYCWMVLWLLLLVILKSWWFGPMKSCQSSVSCLASDASRVTDVSVATVLVPLASLLLTIPGAIYFWQDGVDWSWSNAFSSSAVPQAMVAGASVSLVVACVCFPQVKRAELASHIRDGAASLLPALVILVLAWSLGSVFKELQVATLITELLGGNVSMHWLPFAVFLVGALTSFLTGSSWGTMGILMPLALPVALGFGESVGTEELLNYVPMVIGAVFGGAVFGDNCSPFSDTTIVSSLATGCSARSHVLSQLPYALLAAVVAAFAYALMATGVAAYLATLLSAACLLILVLSFSKRTET